MSNPDKQQILWLSICCILVLFIIFIGGATRLTGSGLSIVEWKPITGIIPPISLQDWEAEFAGYRLFPEYELYNYNISLDEFKLIYYFEYIHRILGRLIAIVFTIPFIYFYTQKQIPRKNLPYYILILILLFAQGVIGWYMVKSGLTNTAHVSHYRLALHLMIAVVIYSLLFWRLISLSAIVG
jgi:heme a synthase